jgi:acetolactate synthase-1/3 small subunit
MDSQFVVSALTEKEVSSLLRVTACLGRHNVEIDSLCCTNGRGDDVYQHTLVVNATPDRVRRAVKQIGACVGVLEVHYHAVEDTLDREVALFRLSVDAASLGNSLAKVVRSGRARILVAGQGYVVLEKTGSRDEIEEFSNNLEPFGVMEFVRSGKVTVTKPRPKLASVV